MVATKQHTFYCFDVLLAHLEKKPVPEPEFTDAEYPLFVTWNTGRGHREHLRGCIGNFNPLPLKYGLKKYALVSALEDRRFEPISLYEVPRLTVGVSLLTDFERVDDCMDWTIGKHGIWIEFLLNGRKTTATYLPEVIPDQGWNKREALESLLHKGGARSITDDLFSTIRLTRYQSSKAYCTHEEYMEYARHRPAPRVEYK